MPSWRGQSRSPTADPPNPPACSPFSFRNHPPRARDILRPTNGPLPLEPARDRDASVVDPAPESPSNGPRQERQTPSSRPIRNVQHLDGFHVCGDGEPRLFLPSPPSVTACCTQRVHSSSSWHHQQARRGLHQSHGSAERQEGGRHLKHGLVFLLSVLAAALVSCRRHS